jgi:hypothetical protein
MMMRHFLLSALLGREKTPLFVELRSLSSGEITLPAALLAALTVNGLEVDDEYLELALGEGHFLILLDGYDELDKASRRKAAKAIQDLAERYPKNWLVVSSRPDTDLQGWTGFTTWHVAPLDLDRAVELVTRLTFDPTIKTRFIDALKRELFERHRSFLSNPLLLSIMLLTYHDTANIPTKLSIFYNQAYESLFQKHDALKAGYQRERMTPLDIQEFARVFAAFSIQSFDKREFTFPSSRALALLDRAKDLTHLSFDSNDFLKDAVQAVCLLVEEGMDIAFAHRSFQEYFTAVFISNATPSQKVQLIKRFARSVGSDEVIPLLHELDEYSTEQHYVLPAIQRLKQAIDFKRTVGKTHYVKYLRLSFSDFRLNENRHLVATIADAQLFHAILFAFRLYLAKPQDTAAPSDQLAQRIEEAFVKEFGGSSTVPTSQIVSNPAFLSTLSTLGGLWGKQTLADLLALEGKIRKRHKETQESLDSILGGRKGVQPNPHL